MGAWNTADLLARCKRQAKRPATDQVTTDPDWYAFLTEAQAEWMTTLANCAPQSQYGAPVMLTTSDGGHTYDFPWLDDADHTLGRVFPMGYVELRATRAGQLLLPCAEWSDAGDFVHEGDLIRIPGGRARTFPDGGPYARYITPPGVIDDATEPVLKPPHARCLLVYRALRKWASQGGRQDPQPYLDLEGEAWYGAPDRGVHGLLGMFKTQFQFTGMEAIPDLEVGSAWWRGMRTD